MNTQEIAYKLWEYLRRKDGERSAMECWLLAEHIQRGNRPGWLFQNGDGACRFTEEPFRL